MNEIQPGTGTDMLQRNWIVVLALVCFAAAITFHSKMDKPIFNLDKQDTALNVNQTFLRMLSVGNKRLISSTFWIQTLLESDHERYEKKDLGNWMYLRFRAIADLDPKFYQNYLYGGLYLSVIKDDLQGAADLFELGLKQYPGDYDLSYYLGFNYFFEMGDYDKGLEILKKIEYHPRASRIVRFVVNKLRFEAGHDYDIAIQFLKDSYIRTQDEGFKQKIAADIYSVVAQRDLECLNANKEDCNKLDATGKPYFKDQNGVWKSVVKFKPYKIFRPKAKETTAPKIQQ